MGSVYFVRCENFVKVGYAANVESRLDDLRTGNPFEIELLVVIPHVTPRIEKFFHEALRHKHHRREWFHFDEEMARRIEMLKRRLENMNWGPMQSQRQVALYIDHRTARERGEGNTIRRKNARAELAARVALSPTRW